MSKSTSFYKFPILLLVFIIAIGLASGDEQEVVTRDAINLTVPNPFGQRPIFETNDQNGRYIGLNLGLLDMMMHYRGGLANTKVDVNLLFGFVRFNYDRLPLADGQRQGPIKFSMFGKSLYDNKEQSNA